jgi:uncharacterized membrane protein YraQ (UPF0718 family)
MRSLIKKYRVFLSITIINFLLIIFFPAVGSKSIEISINSLVKMLIIVPPIFLILGLFDVWVPREAIMKLMGERSGLLGLSLALLLGSFSAGPLYAAFPVAAMLMNKGCKFSNILLSIGAWATTKVPMLLFEAGSMGWPFMLTRLIINIPGIIIIAYIVEMFVSYEEREFIYQRGLSL